MTRHTHPTEPRTADVVPFPPLLAHWPADAVALSVMAPLPACSGLLVWRPARAAVFWVVTDEHGAISEAWPLRYSATEDQVQDHAQHRPCFQYREPEERHPPQPEPKRQRRQSTNGTTR